MVQPLDDRSVPAAGIASYATPIALDSVARGSLTADRAVLYQVVLPEPGRLVVDFQTDVTTPRLMLLDYQGMNIFGGPTRSADPNGVLTSTTLGAGTYFLLAGSSRDGTDFLLTTRFTPNSVLSNVAPEGRSVRDPVTADFNSDGVPDVAAVVDQSLYVYLGRGNGTFQAPTKLTAGSDPSSTVVGDFDGDRNLDFALVDGDGDSVSVMLGRGDGSFLPPVRSAAGALPYLIAAGDFNGDGVSDLVAATSDLDFNLVVLLGTGEGTFRRAGTYNTGRDAPRSVVTADLDGDGITDIAATSLVDEEVSVLRGDGKGGFREAGAFDAGDTPFSMVSADFNGDGVADLATASVGEVDVLGNPIPGSGIVSILLGRRGGGFRPRRTYEAGAFLTGLAVADFNGDGVADLAVASTGDAVIDDPAEVGGVVSVLLGNRDGSLQPRLVFPSFAWTPLLAADFNGDSLTDLLTSSIESVVLLPGNGDGTFQTQRVYPVRSGVDDLATADFNGDGLPDLAVANTVDASISILYAGRDGTFRPQQVLLIRSNLTGLVVADFNGDDIPDLAAVSKIDRTFVVLLGASDGGFLGQEPQMLPFDPEAILAGDFNGDGFDDLASADTGDVGTVGVISVVLSLGDGNFSDRRFYGEVTGQEALVSGDFNGDGVMDLASVTRSTPGDLPDTLDEHSVSVLWGLGDGTFRDARVYPVAVRPSGLIGGDFNGDGLTDVAVVDGVGNRVSILAGRRDVSLGDERTYAVGLHPGAMITGDFDGDGITDLAVANQGGDSVSVLLGRRVGRLAQPPARAVGKSPQSLALGDYNGDSIPDLVAVNFDDGTVSLLLGTGDGTFLPQRFYAGLPEAMFPIAADFNGDGRLDLAIGSRKAHGVAVLLNNGRGGLEPLIVGLTDLDSDPLTSDVLQAFPLFVSPGFGPALANLALPSQRSTNPAAGGPSFFRPPTPAQLVSAHAGAPPASDRPSASSSYTSSGEGAALGLLTDVAALTDVALDSVLAEATSEAAVSSAFTALGGTPGQGVDIDGVGLALSNSRLTTRLDVSSPLGFVGPGLSAFASRSGSAIADAFASLAGSPESNPVDHVGPGGDDTSSLRSLTAAGTVGEHPGGTELALEAEPWERAVLRLDDEFRRAADRFREEVLGPGSPRETVGSGDRNARLRAAPTHAGMVEAALGALAPEAGSSGPAAGDDVSLNDGPGVDNPPGVEIPLTFEEPSESDDATSERALRVSVAVAIPLLMAACRRARGRLSADGRTARRLRTHSRTSAPPNRTRDQTEPYSRG